MYTIINLFFACVCNTLFRYAPFCFQFGDPAENHTSYAVGQALSYLFLLRIISDFLPYIKEVDKRVVRVTFDIVAWCAISNLVDELFFDPLHLGLNELAFTLFITIWTIRKWTIYKPGMS